MDHIARSAEAAKKQYDNNRKGRTTHSTLSDQVRFSPPLEMWPTPIASSSQSASMDASKKEAERLHPKGQNHLAAAVFNPEQILPTPTSRDWKGGYRTESLIRNDGKSRAMDQLPNAAIGGVGTEKVVGHLNPDWVEWLMGYAPGYTDPDYTEPMQLAEHLGFESEPAIPRVTTKKEHRVNRLKCLGNSIVPQIMHEIGNAILKDKEADGVK